MKIKDIYSAYISQCSGVTVDSRLPQKGAMFFALHGKKVDGNEFAKDAIKNGATYAVVDRPDCKHGENYILVDDVLQTLQSLAKLHRSQLQIPVLAITGSMGKTTTKELVFYILSKNKNCFIVYLLLINCFN